MQERPKLPRNDLLRAARLRQPSPHRPGQPMSRQELADAANAYIARFDEGEATLDANHIGKLERGVHRWMNDLRREAFRHVLGAARDAELGFYIIRGIRTVRAAGAERTGMANGALARRDQSQNETDSPELTASWQPDSIDRRTVLRASLSGAPLALLGSALTLDDIKHVAAAMDDAGRYLDRDVVEHLRRRLSECAADDGRHGPKAALPAVLAVIFVVEYHARHVKPAVRRELLRVGARAAELAGWLYRDAGMPELAEYWRDRATEWALEASDHAMPAYVLLKKSQSAWDARDALRMLTLAQAVQASPLPLPPRVRAEAAQQEARGLAMIDGNMAAATGKLNEAAELFASDTAAARTGSDRDLANHYDGPLLAVQTAICHCEAGLAERAVEIYQGALDSSVFSRRDLAYFQTLMGIALTAANLPDEAATIGLKALPIAVLAGSVRTLNELGRLRAKLLPWERRPQVHKFAASLPF